MVICVMIMVKIVGILSQKFRRVLVFDFIMIEEHLEVLLNCDQT